MGHSDGNFSSVCAMTFVFLRRTVVEQSVVLSLSFHPPNNFDQNNTYLENSAAHAATKKITGKVTLSSSEDGPRLLSGRRPIFSAPPRSSGRAQRTKRFKT